jgi:hypothetical protein
VGAAMQSQTREVQPGIEPTAEFSDWAAANGALRRKYPAIWGFFGPDGGEFDYDVYVRQIRSGQRQSLDPEEWLNLVNNHLGQMQVDRMTEALGPSDTWTEEDRVVKREIEEAIADEYPGFRDFSGLDQRPEADVILREMHEAVDDPAVSQTAAGEALRVYLRARTVVVGFAADDGLNADTEAPWTYDLSRPKSLEGDREFLYDIGTQLAIEVPDFARMWDRQLRHEVEPEEVTR